MGRAVTAAEAGHQVERQVHPKSRTSTVESGDHLFEVSHDGGWNAIENLDISSIKTKRFQLDYVANLSTVKGHDVHSSPCKRAEKTARAKQVIEVMEQSRR